MEARARAEVSLLTGGSDRRQRVARATRRREARAFLEEPVEGRDSACGQGHGQPKKPRRASTKWERWRAVSEEGPWRGHDSPEWV